MIWYEEELRIKDMPDGHYAHIFGEYEDNKLRILLRYQTPIKVYEAELWSKEIKSKFKPNVEYSSDDILETYEDKIEKNKSKCEGRDFKVWLTFLAANMDDIDKAKQLLMDNDC